MKTLYLLRHAKSSLEEPSLPDFDRPLNARGRAGAPLMARHMKKQGWIPDLILCSTAARTLETLERIRPVLSPDIPVGMEPRLYLAKRGTLLSVLRAAPERANRVLMIAHNPGMARLAAGLAGPGSDDAAVRRVRLKYPTAALAVFEFDIEGWDEVDLGRGALTHHVRPKDLSAGT